MIAADMGLDLIEINFEKNLIREINNSSDFSVDKILSEIEVISKKKITEKSIIFLDEIQAQPQALNALRYIYEDKPGLRVIAASSLLEVVMHKQQLRMPVGRVEYYYLGPMTFSEFLLALGEEQLKEQIELISLENPPLKVVHERCTDLLKQFYLVGGMPEAVKSYVDTRDFAQVRAVHNSLVYTFRDDIPKYSKGMKQELVQAVYEYTSQRLGNKVVYSDISNSHSSLVKQAIDTLAMANVIYKCCNNRASGLPLKAGVDSRSMKLYFVDVGLYNAVMGLEWKDLFYLSPEELITKGNIAEQFVAQHLVFRTPESALAELYYWLRGGKAGAAEIDFLISQSSEIYPIEVKSGASGKMRSLWQYVMEKGAKRVIRIDLSLRRRLSSLVKHKVSSATGTQAISCELVGLPLYAIENLNELLRFPEISPEVTK